MWTAGKWSNPGEGYQAQAGVPRREVLAAYEARVRATPELMAALPELRGMRLGCGCSYSPCHTEVLRKIFNEVCLGSPARLAESPIPLFSDDPVWVDLGRERDPPIWVPSLRLPGALPAPAAPA